MKLTYDGELFKFTCSYGDRDHAQKAGFVFDPSLKCFYTRAPQVAARLRTHADKSAREKLDAVLIRREPWTGRIPFPPSQTPKDFQLETAIHLLSRNRAYAALDPGMGKTVVAALTMNALAEENFLTDQHFVYLCPPFLVTDVKDKLAPWRVARLDPEIIPESNLHKILTPKALRAMRKRVHDKAGEMILYVDEAHRYKNPVAQRTRALFGHVHEGVAVPGIVEFFDRVYFLSGTPMPNRPMELYPVLSKCAPETIRFMNKFDFGRRYCGGYRTNFGWDFSGASNVEELAAKVIPSFMIRLRKHLLGLPAKSEEIVLIGERMPHRLLKLDAKILREHSPEDLMKGQIGEEHISTYRKKLGIAKVKPALQFIRAALEDTDEAIIVIAIHREVVKQLKEGLKKFHPLVIDGSVEPKARLAIAKEFQGEKNRRIIILNAVAGGTGFDLTKATRVMFVEFTWVPGDNDQAADRAHRYGQRKSVSVQYLVYKNSIDRVVIEALFKKKKAIKHV